MSFYEHLGEFEGLAVYDYEIGGGLRDPATTAPRLRWDPPPLNLGYVPNLVTSFVRGLFGRRPEPPPAPAPVVETNPLADLLQQPEADRLRGLVIGTWIMYGDSNSSAGQIIEMLVAAAERLPSLRSLFFGDITQDECEVSWLEQTDVSALWQALPRLESLGIRGSNGLRLGKIEHEHLRKLVLENGGLPRTVLAEITAARLPNLEHLEIYLGDGGYGWDGTIDDVRPLLTGVLFPKLRYLGLRNSQIADEIAAAVVDSPLLPRLETLDLSLGTLSDTGGRALAASPAIRNLKKLDLHHHYLSDDVMQSIAALGIEVNVSEQEQGYDEFERYCSVAE